MRGYFTLSCRIRSNDGGWYSTELSQDAGALNPFHFTNFKDTCPPIYAFLKEGGYYHTQGMLGIPDNSQECLKMAHEVRNVISVFGEGREGGCSVLNKNNDFEKDEG